MKTQKNLVALLLACTLTALSGCASLPSTEVMKAETAGYQVPKLPEPGNSLVWLPCPSLFVAIKKPD